MIDDRLEPLMSSDSVECYTPLEVIERVILVLEEIDLDPCSECKRAPNVPAREHFTKEDDGLAQPWHGRVYMNPPYGRVIGDWIEKLCQEYEAGRVTQALALVPARTDTQWMVRLRAFPRCYIRGRLRFGGHDNSAPFPSVVVALGCDLETFVEAFGDMGDVYQLARLPDQGADAAEPLGGNGQEQAGGLPPKSGAGGHNDRGWVEIKEINGRPYAYRRWREGGVKHSKYLGKVGDS